MSLVNPHDVKQIAYIVPDVRAAAAAHAALFGSGPVFLQEHMELPGHYYRGRSCSMDVDVALGQWGDIQLELVQMNDERPSIWREVPVPAAGTFRHHHLCLHPPDLPATIAAFEAAGYPLIFEFQFIGGTRAAMVDTLRTLGHFIELFEPTPELRFVYDAVRNAARDFDGSRLIRPLADILARIPA